MRKILLAALVTIYSTITLAGTPIIELTEGWKTIPIVVVDNASYFYSHQVCPPEIVVVPPPCAKEVKVVKQVQEVTTTTTVETP